MAGCRAVATPLPLHRMRNKTGRHRIQDDVSVRPSEVDVVADEDRLESALQQVAGALVAPVRLLREDAVHQVHRIGEIAIKGLDHRVVVVPHQAVGQTTQAVPFRRFTEEVQKSQSIGVVVEDDTFPVPPRHDVVDSGFELNSRSSGHAASTYKTRTV